jgi:hypothetical protein
VDVLIAQKATSARDVAMALNLPLIDLKRHTVQPQAAAQVPLRLARRFRRVITGGALT